MAEKTGRNIHTVVAQATDQGANSSLIRGLRAVPRSRSDGGDASERVSVSQPQGQGPETVHDQSVQTLGGHAEKRRRAVLRPLRASAQVRYEAKRRGAADHTVTQMLRQGDAEVFKLYS